MASPSVSIVAKNNVTIEVPLGVAKESKTIKRLIASNDVLRHKKPILLKQLSASTLESVFEWCEANRGQPEFSMKRTFTDEYARIEFTAWQRDFFERKKLSWFPKTDRSRRWDIVLAAEYLDIPLLYFSTCQLLCLDTWAFEKKIRDDVSDDILCDILRFRSYAYQHANLTGWRTNARVVDLIESPAGDLPLKHVDTELKGNVITIRQLDEDPPTILRKLEELAGYAITSFSIYFHKEQCKVLEAFLSEPNVRLRVKKLNIGGLPRENHVTFRAFTTQAKKLIDRLDLLEKVNFGLNCDAHVDCLVDDPDLLAFVAPKLSLWIGKRVDGQKVLRLFGTLHPPAEQALSIRFADHACVNLVAFMWKMNKIFNERTELSPLAISAPASNAEAHSLREAAAKQGLVEGASSHHHYIFEKERDDEWKICVSYRNSKLSMEIKKVGQ